MHSLQMTRVVPCPGPKLGGAARLEIASDNAARHKFVETGMRLHHVTAGSRQRTCSILNPQVAVRLRQSAGNIAHNCD